MKFFIKISILFIVLCCGYSNVKAQQLPFYCHYFVNPMLYNPAMTGYGYQSSVFFQNRSQYGSNYVGAPKTNVASFETTIKKRTVGLGGIIFDDKVGLLEKTGVYFNYAYKLQIDKDNRFLFGVSAGLYNSKIKFTDAVIIDAADPLILASTQSAIVPDASFGAYYLYKKAEVGISFPQVLGSKGSFTDLGKTTSIKNKPNFYATLKYNFTIVKAKQIKFSPLVLLKANSGKMQYDLNAIFTHPKLGWAGVTYKSDYAIGISVGANINNVLIGYQYEIPTTAIAKNVGINYEILFGLKFGKKEVVKKTVPRAKY